MPIDPDPYPDRFSDIASDAEEEAAAIEALEPADDEDFDPDDYAAILRNYLAARNHPLCGPEEARRIEAVMVRIGKATGVWVGPISNEN